MDDEAHLIHDWRETGRGAQKHVDLGTARPGVWYLRCAACGQCGFRRARSQLVYTWERAQ
jgi:hypothetical protein